MSNRTKVIIGVVVLLFAVGTLYKCGYTPDPKAQAEKSRSAN